MATLPTFLLRTFSLCLCVLATACGGGSPDATVPAPVTAPLAPFQLNSAAPLSGELERFRAHSGLPGLSLVVVDGERIDAAVAGVRRSDRAAPVEAADQFHVGSLTKAATATLIARLVEQGRLRYDATLAELFPAWEAGFAPAWRKVTVAQLLLHRSGMKRDTSAADAAVLAPQASGDMSRDRMVVARYLLGQPPASVPGTAYMYSNLGYLLLGVIAHTAAGEHYEALMQREVFAPLQMKAQFGLDEGAALAGHRRNGGGWQPASYDPLDIMAIKVSAAAGGMKLSMADYGLFLREHLRGLRGRSAFLTQASFASMHTPVDGMGMGWAVEDHPTLGRITLHLGSIGTFSSMTVMLPGRDRAVAITCNCDSEEDMDKIQRFVLAVAGKAGTGN